jgi:hypothetical protein
MCDYPLFYPPYRRSSSDAVGKIVIGDVAPMPSYPWPKPLHSGADILKALRLWIAEPDSIEERRERITNVEQMLKSLNG